MMNPPEKYFSPVIPLLFYYIRLDLGASASKICLGRNPGESLLFLTLLCSPAFMLTECVETKILIMISHRENRQRDIQTKRGLQEYAVLQGDR